MTERQPDASLKPSCETTMTARPSPSTPTLSACQVSPEHVSRFPACAVHRPATARATPLERGLDPPRFRRTPTRTRRRLHRRPRAGVHGATPRSPRGRMTVAGLPSDTASCRKPFRRPPEGGDGSLQGSRFDGRFMAHDTARYDGPREARFRWPRLGRPEETVSCALGVARTKRRRRRTRRTARNPRPTGGPRPCKRIA